MLYKVCEYQSLLSLTPAASLVSRKFFLGWSWRILSASSVFWCFYHDLCMNVLYDLRPESG